MSTGADLSSPIADEAPQYRVSFDAERTARYHAARRGFFESIHRWTMFFVVLLGTAAFGGLAARWNYGPAVIGAFTAILGAANLAFDPSGRARAHEALQRKAFELGAEIDGVVNPSDEDCARWRAELHKIFADEPPPRRALDAVVYNATLSGRRENPDGDLLVTTFSQRLLKQFLSFANARFPRRRELQSGATQ